jgi:hypothetical protein
VAFQGYEIRPGESPAVYRREIFFNLRRQQMGQLAGDIRFGGRASGAGAAGMVF